MEVFFNWSHLSSGSNVSVTFPGSVEELLPVTLSESHISMAHEDTSTVLNTLYKSFYHLYWKLPPVTSTVLNIDIPTHWQECKILGPDTHMMAIFVNITYHITPSSHNSHCTEKPPIPILAIRFPSLIHFTASASNQMWHYFDQEKAFHKWFHKYAFFIQSILV